MKIPENIWIKKDWKHQRGGRKCFLRWKTHLPHSRPFRLFPFLSSLRWSHDPRLVWSSIPSLWQEDWLQWSSGGRKKRTSVFTQIESGHTWTSNWKIADSTVMRFGGDTTHQMKLLCQLCFTARSSLETSPRGPNHIRPKSYHSKGQSKVIGQPLIWEAVCSLCTLWGIIAMGSLG